MPQCLSVGARHLTWPSCLPPLAGIGSVMETPATVLHLYGPMMILTCNQMHAHSLTVSSLNESITP